MLLRPYQSDAKDAVNAHLATRDTNPLVVIPTAGGKTVVFATLIKEWSLHPHWPAPRVIILAHVKELLTQAEKKLLAVWPDAPVGVFSAGLKRREGASQITIASIQSVFKRAHEFRPFDVVIVDEAHLIPLKGEGMYRRFIKDAKAFNPALRVIGFTATPYRLSGGHIAAEGHILEEVCYQAEIEELVAQGFISTLRSKATEEEIDVVGVRTQNGDYITAEIDKRANTESTVRKAVAEIVRRGQDRKSWLLFACTVSHARNIVAELARQGVHAELVTGETDDEDRESTIRRFDAGEVRAVVNVNCLTTGLDVTRVDLIGMLRPTASTSLYIQMVGRGFRLHPGKIDCLVLDFGGNVRRHGPVNAIRLKSFAASDGKKKDAPTKVCPNCEEILHAAAAECSACHFAFPPREAKHSDTPDNVSILRTAEPWTVAVSRVEVKRHEKIGKPPSLCVTYYGDGLSDYYRDFICLEHGGTAGQRAAHWWKYRFGDPVPATVDDALSILFLAHRIQEITDTITVRQSGKYTEIINVHLRTEHARTVFA